MKRIEPSQLQAIEKKSTEALDEFLKQIAAQSPFLAGFAFAALSAVSYDANTPFGLYLAFGVVTSLVIGLELLALLVGGMLSTLSKRHSVTDKFGTEALVVLFSYFAGWALFTVSLALLALMKFGPLGLYLAVVVALMGAAGAFLYYRVRKRLNKLAEAEGIGSDE